MRNSRLISTLQLLHPEEWTAFDHFLQSPFFADGSANNRASVYQLFCYIKEYAPDLDHDELERKSVCESLFPTQDEEKSQKRLEKLMSALMAELRHFIAVYSKIDPLDEFEELLYLAKFYQRSYDQFNNSRSALKKAQSILEHEAAYFSQYFYKKFSLVTFKK